MEGKGPVYEKGSTSESNQDDILYGDAKENPEVEENEENNDDLESITDLSDLSPKIEVEDQGDQGVVIAANNCGDQPPVAWDDPFFLGLLGYQLHPDEFPQTPSWPHPDNSNDEE